MAVREESHSRRVLTDEERTRRYRAFEHLVADIAAICGIRDAASKCRLLRWKLRRRLELMRSTRRRAVKLLRRE